MGRGSLGISMGMREDIRIPLTMLSISFLDKLPYKGSYNGKRFLFEKVKVEKNEDNENSKSDCILKVYLWKDLYNFENTDKKDMIIKEFEYSKDGIEEGINFVEETKV